MATRRRDRPARIVDAGLGIIAEKGWPAVTLEAVATESGLDPVEVYRLTPTRAAILDLFARRIDIEVAASGGAAPLDDLADETPRDRLCDVLMRRFDALEPYRDAISALSRDLPRDPVTVASLIPQARRSFAMMLREAGISDIGMRGFIRVNALIGVWMAVLVVWLRDDTGDNAQTMAALDRHLGRLAEWSPLFRPER